MPGSVYGTAFRVATYGESHGAAIGAVVDGCPAGLRLDAEYIQKELDKRRPGASDFSSARKEMDHVELLSGVSESVTTGGPVSMIIRNTDARSGDYESGVFRPGHADYSYFMKYGLPPLAGGGRGSGRETAARVAAGAIAKRVLEELDVSVLAYTSSIGEARIDTARFDLAEIDRNPFRMPDALAAMYAAELTGSVREDGDSLGSVVACEIKGLKPGIGEPVFSKLDAELAKAVVSIGGVKGVEFGAGFGASAMRGSQNNDAFRMNGKMVVKATNNAGGVLGGMSDGNDVTFCVHFKPVPSIAKQQNTVNSEGREVSFSVRGRHDPVIAPRAVPVVSAMAAIVVTNLIFLGILSKMDSVIKAYKNDL